MATQELRKRANWQTISGAKALKVEKLFNISLQSALDAVFPKQFRVDQHPKEFQDIYSIYPLSKDILDKIYNIDVFEQKKNGKPKYKWGISVKDYQILAPPENGTTNQPCQQDVFRAECIPSGQATLKP